MQEGIGRADLILLKTKKLKSKDNSKPNSKEICLVEIAGVMVEGEVIDYFDDDNNIEHARIRVKDSGNIVVRPTNKVSKK